VIYATEAWKRWPIPAVIAMPRQPPIRTRKVGISSLEPEVFAPIAPATMRPAIVKPTIETEMVPIVGANAAKNGIKPPIAKERADAIEA
jgi:hypothetical protein